MDTERILYLGQLCLFPRSLQLPDNLLLVLLCEHALVVAVFLFPGRLFQANAADCWLTAHQFVFIREGEGALVEIS
jgi:hypothetical protein